MLCRCGVDPSLLTTGLRFCSGNKENQIHFEGYQVSDQCMALVRDECLIPTIDAPELAYVKESSNEQYVPDVFYKVSIMHLHVGFRHK